MSRGARCSAERLLAHQWLRTMQRSVTSFSTATLSPSGASTVRPSSTSAKTCFVFRTFPSSVLEGREVRLEGGVGGRRRMGYGRREDREGLQMHQASEPGRRWQHGASCTLRPLERQGTTKQAHGSAESKPTRDIVWR